MKALILAGGSGTRLWPLSRKNFPKQFLKLHEDNSLLQKTIKRLLNVFSPEDLIVMTNNEYKFHVISDLNSISNSSRPINNIILEPISRNTAPAIALGIKYCIEKLGATEEEFLFISPSDHLISPDEKFSEYLKIAEEISCEGYIVIFGLKPKRTETGYGYIKAGNRESSKKSKRFFKVEKFTEKPDSKTAEKYIKDSSYYWNSGMFAFKIGTMIEEFKKYAPDINDMLGLNYDEMVEKFNEMPDISIDYSIAERSKKMTVLPIDVFWNDIGSWDSLYDVIDKDENGNAKMADAITIDTKNTLILSNKRLISTIGIKDCLIIDTDDAILIAKKGETQKVREIVNILNSSKRKEALEHLTTHRPWGSYTILEEGARYKIKRIVVNPGASLSLQMHYHRSEHWVVIKGAAKVTIGDKESYIHENESIYVPKSTLHRLENPGKVLLEIIEVQNGEYVGEDDIVRIDDIYGRKAN